MDKYVTRERELNPADHPLYIIIPGLLYYRPGPLDRSVVSACTGLWTFKRLFWKFYWFVSECQHPHHRSERS